MINRVRFEYYPADKKAPPVTVKAELELTSDHVANFLSCIRSRKLPNGDVLIGHRSAQASHLANISYVERPRIRFDPVREEIPPL